MRNGNVMWRGEGNAAVVISESSLVEEADSSVIDEEDEAKENKRLVQGIRIRAVLRLLAQEVGFLLDPSVVQAIESLPEKDVELHRAEGLLKALGVKTEARMAVLLKYFFHEESPGSPTASTLIEAEEEREQKVKPTDELLLFNTAEEVLELRSMISPEDVVSAVKTFIDDVSDGSAVGGRTVDDTVINT